MKEFNEYGKVNFVDDNNVFVGYDMNTSCCEDAGYFISEQIKPYDWEGNHLDGEVLSTDGYQFDPEFFEDVASRDLDSGGQVAFRLTKENHPDLYLQLYNAHNGYYSHGFVFKDAEKVMEEAYL